MPCNCGKNKTPNLPVPAEMTKIVGVNNVSYNFEDDSDFMLVQYIYPNSALTFTSSDPKFQEKYGMRNYGRQALGYRFYILKSDYEASQLYQDRLAVIETNEPEPEVVEEPVAQVEEKPVETSEEEVVENTEEKPVEAPEEEVVENKKEEKPKRRRTSKKKAEETSEDNTEESEE